MTRSRAAVVVLGVAAVAAAVVAVARCSPGTDRVTAEAADGALCSTCHETRPTDEAHVDASCLECHVTSETLLTKLYWLSVGVGSDVPEHGQVPDPSCHDCHERDEEAWRGLVATEGHAAHLPLEGFADCVSCHSRQLHGTEGEPAGCESCHRDVEQHGLSAEIACTACHRFDRDAEFVLPGDVVPTPVATTGDDASVGAEDVHGAADCRRCHNPHDAQELTAAELDCQSCHRAHLEEAQAGGPEGHSDCLGCHTVHAPRTHIARDCINCHTIDEEEGGWNVEEAGVPLEVQAEIRTRISHEAKCGTCHAPHTWIASDARCGDCHEENAAGIAALPEESHTRCGQCHQPHEPPPGSSVCRGCHSAQGASQGASPGRHRDCVSCHDAHGGRPTGGICRSCHDEQGRQLSGQAAEHRRCGSCHTAHGSPAAGSRAACTRCHTEEATQLAAGGSPPQHQCGGCHLPHTFPADPRVANRCASCHANAVAGDASHRGACSDCHGSHDRLLTRVANCRSCHDSERPQVPEHQDCAGCHSPHQPALRARANCRSCHASEVGAMASWPRGTPHAGECARCHTPHDEGTTATCASCHATQTASSHRGSHTQCVQCHDPHQSRPGGARGWWGRCAQCHQAEGRAVAAAAGTAHGICQNCHETPGTPLPTCQGCHSRMSGVLNHRSHSSASCTDCHAQHGNRSMGRAQCVRCHDDLTRHYPDATTCQSCHPFTR